MRGEPDKRSFGYMLVALSALFAGTVVLDYTGRFLTPRLVVGISVVLLVQVLLLAVVQVERGRARSLFGFRLLIAAAIVVQLVSALVGHPTLQIVAPLLGAIAIGYTIVAVLGHLIRARDASTETIYAAICVYLLMGVFWSVIYSVMARIEPDAFMQSNGSAPPLGAGAGSISSLYYSMVTLTTLGYGDVTPVTTAARMSAAIEATLGQVFLVVLVARLVGLNVAHSMPKGRQ